MDEDDTQRDKVPSLTIVDWAMVAFTLSAVISTLQVRIYLRVLYGEMKAGTADCF